DAAPVTRTITASVQLNPPPFTFVSLNPSCDNHTLVVRLGGNLHVGNNVYVNSCSTADGFDLFGTNGTFEVSCAFSTDPNCPASGLTISTFGGWETHNNDIVIENGVTCVPQPPGTTKVAPPDPSPPWPGCPLTGQPLVIDPLQGQVAPPVQGTPAWS